MFFKLMLIFIFVPLIELYFLLEIGQMIGIFSTIMVIVFTGALGVSIARKQGYQVVNNIRANLNAGRIPTDDLVSALLILIGGVTLLTPGFLTDITGFLLILPGSRDIIAKIVKKRFIKYVEENKVEVHRSRRSYNPNQKKYNKDDFIDIEAEEVDENDK
jgi:UPF0716 protein FxsA